MAELLLIDFGDGQGDAATSHPIEGAKKKAQDSLIPTTNSCETSLVGGVIVKININGRSTSHSEGVSMGIDMPNNNLIISQKPQIPGGGAHLRLSVSLGGIQITDNQGRAISVETGCDKDTTTLHIKACTDFKREIIQHSKNMMLRQSQDQGLVQLMCSLSDADLCEGSILEISEVCRDIWGEKNKLVEIFSMASSGSRGEELLQVTRPDVWQGLEYLDLEFKSLQVSSPETQKTASGPWFDPGVVYSPKRRRNNRNNRRERKATRGPPSHHRAPRPGLPSSSQHSPRSTGSQLPERRTSQFLTSDQSVASNSLPASSESSKIHYIDINSKEGQEVEQQLKKIEADAKAFWDTRVSPLDRNRRKPESRYSANPGQNARALAAIDSGASTRGRQAFTEEGLPPTHTDGYDPVVRGNGRERGYVRRRGGNVLSYAAVARGEGGGREQGRGRHGGRGGRRGSQGHARPSNSESINPFEPNQGEEDMHRPRVSQNGREPFGGWERVKASRRGEFQRT